MLVSPSPAPATLVAKTGEATTALWGVLLLEVSGLHRGNRAAL